MAANEIHSEPLEMPRRLPKRRHISAGLVSFITVTRKSDHLNFEISKGTIRIPKDTKEH